MRLYLCSKSPRRREILSSAGFQYDVISVETEEVADESRNIPEQISGIAMEKAMAGWESLTETQKVHSVVLGADTSVVLNDQLLGKPVDKEDAKRILSELSATTHQVITGCALVQNHNRLEFSETSTVVFKTLSEDEIDSYVASGEPMDKAGAYGIQGLGRRLVGSYQGSFANIVGLPIEALQLRLADWGVRPEKETS